MIDPARSVNFRKYRTADFDPVAALWTRINRELAPAGMDPYSIFATPTEGPGVTGGSAAMNPPVQMATYPVEGGVLDTVQWEAVRGLVEATCVN